MKTIYVTVAEFLENGGKLEPGRSLFTWYSRQHRIADWKQVYDPKEHKDLSKFYVAIECEPKYI